MEIYITDHQMISCLDLVLSYIGVSVWNVFFSHRGHVINSFSLHCVCVKGEEELTVYRYKAKHMGVPFCLLGFYGRGKTCEIHRERRVRLLGICSMIISPTQYFYPWLYIDAV